MESIWDAVSAIGGVVSAGTTIIAVYFAKQALTAWRDQEKLKLKIEFKKSVLNLRNLFLYMPKNWDKIPGARSALNRNSTNLIHGPSVINTSLPPELKSILDALNHANDCWVMCEHIFDGTSVESNWRSSITAIDDYLNFKISNTDVFEVLNSTYSSRFIFEFK